jgi:UDP-N-acetylmuramate dehydrogenase
MVLPEDAEEIAAVTEICRNNGIPCLIMGNGTNLLVSDAGYRGVVIKLGGRLNAASLTGAVVTAGETITAGAGIALSALARFALEHGLSGLEFAEGIPGTLGGAVAMNAGAYDGEIKNIFVSGEVLEVGDEGGGITRRDNKSMNFGYRTSAVQSGGIVLEATLKLKEAPMRDIQEKMDDYKQRRREKQPLELPSAGSVFKRPEGHFAGKLIMDCGLAGYAIGGAQVSPKHCGFIVNRGGASADDVLRLIAHIQTTVRQRFGVELETEIKIIGQ